MPALLRRLNVYGDFWLRFLFYAARVCPWFLEPVFNWAFSVPFYLFLKKARRAVSANLRVVRPQRIGWRNAADTFRVLHNFGWTLTDLAHVRLGHEVIDWEVAGQKHLDALAATPDGAIVLTAHMGNYDVAAPLFGSRLRRRIHTVRAPERDADMQRFMDEKNTTGSSEWLAVHYNLPGSMLAVELTKLLQAGEIVAIQGDRVLFDVSPQTLEYRDGIRWQLPRGPFLLAHVTRAPIVPVFIIRIGWRRYRIEAGEPFQWTGDPRDKAAALEAAAQWWNERLRDVVERHWYQWFVFEEAFDTPPMVGSESKNEDLEA